MKISKPPKHYFQIGRFTPESLYALNLIPLLDALGWKGSNTDLTEALIDEPDNMDLEGLMKTMSNLKYEGKRVKGKIKEKDLPCLSISNKNVFVLINKTEAGYHVFDGKRGTYRILKKTPVSQKKYIFFGLKDHRFSLLKPQKKWFQQVLHRFTKEWLFTGILSLLNTVFSFMTPLIIMLTYSQIQSADEPSILIYLGIALLLFIIAQNGFKYLRSLLLTDVSERIGYIISNEVFRRLLYLPPQYTEIASVQQQTNRIRDFESIKSFFADKTLSNLIDAPLSFLLLGGLIFISGPVVIVPLAAIIVYALVAFFTYRIYKGYTQKNIHQQNNKNLLQNEIFSFLVHIRNSGLGRKWLERYKKLSCDHLKAGMNNMSYIQSLNVFAKAISSITLIITISVCVIRVIQGQMDGGSLFGTFLLTSRLLTPIGNSLTTLTQYGRFQKSIEQINKLMSLSIEQRPQSITRIYKQLDGSIEFKNVFLKYNREYSPALMNLSFKVQRHSMMNIIGHGGSGRSSLFKMILGMYQPFTGSILIDNANLKQIDTIRLRKSIAYIPSESVIFKGTVLSNLYLTRTDANDTMIEEAIRNTGFSELISQLPEFLNTPVNKISSYMNIHYFNKFLNFVQAILRDAPIVLIDEPEKGISEEQLNTLIPVIKFIKETRTVLMITSHPALIDLAETTLWLDKGRIRGYGLSQEIYRKFENDSLEGAGSGKN